MRKKFCIKRLCQLLHICSAMASWAPFAGQKTAKAKEISHNTKETTFKKPKQNKKQPSVLRGKCNPSEYHRVSSSPLTEYHYKGSAQ